MNFVSLPFVVLLVTLFVLFVGLPARLRLPLLLVASYVFYATWSVPFLAIILFTTSTDYWMSQIIHKSKQPGVRKAALATGLAINLLILGFFKYANFILDTSHGMAHWLGYTLTWPHALDIILPLGISFYTFEAISYMVDVYRGHEPARNWLDYNFYIMYFPHLISGPIIRFGELAPQYSKPLELPSMERLARGCELILLGYAFKVFIADNVAPISDGVFENPAAASVFASYLAAVAFTVQIYFDFMGYTHIARGVSLLFNIQLPLNFNHPYHANNISNFWERWHISLSRWIRDYLYFPLGGSRCSIARTVINLLVTMLICGAWHGAGWTFIAWGGYHGVLLAGYHVYKEAKKTWLSGFSTIFSHPAYHWASLTATFICVVVGWVLFRAHHFEVAQSVLLKMANVPAFLNETAGYITSGHLSDLFLLLTLLALCFIGPTAVRFLNKVYLPLPFWGKAQVASILAVICWILTANSVQPFIYFQF